MKLRQLLSISLLLALSATSAAAERDERSEDFRVGQVLQDREPGPARNWTESLPDRPIDRVVVRARRESGTTDTQLRLGLAGAAGETSKQIDAEQLHDIVWDLGGQRPTARQIELQALNGKVYVDTVTVEFADTRRGALGTGRDDQERLSSQSFREVERLAKRLDDQAEQALQSLRDDRSLREEGSISRDIERLVEDIDRFEDSLADSRDNPERLAQNVRRLDDELRSVQRDVEREDDRSAVADNLNEMSDTLADLERTLEGRGESRRRDSIFPF